MKKIAILALLAPAALVVPAQASKTSKSHKCQPHAVSYVASGKLASGSLTRNSDGTYTGTLTVNVTKTNEHGKADRDMTRIYELASAKVKLHGENPATLTPGSQIKLKGTITTLARNCTQTGFTPTTTIKKADIKPPKPTKKP